MGSGYFIGVEGYQLLKWRVEKCRSTRPPPLKEWVGKGQVGSDSHPPRVRWNAERSYPTSLETGLEERNHPSLPPLRVDLREFREEEGPTS